MADDIRPGTGWGVLHLFLAVEHRVVEELPAGAGKDLTDVLERAGDDLQLHVFSVLGHKADVMLVAIGPSLTRLRRLQTEVLSCQAGPALELVWSYVSLTETSEYTPTHDQEESRLRSKGIEGEELTRLLEKFDERTHSHVESRLHPEMPEWEVACFYPMSHRRDGDDNWYSLPFDERLRLMSEHGRSGRAFAGRVVQLVSGSTGLDDWEWGVTLFAHDLADLKEIVYRLRYDEASARYGDFGPFIVGLRRTPAELVDEVGL